MWKALIQRTAKPSAAVSWIYLAELDRQSREDIAESSSSAPHEVTTGQHPLSHYMLPPYLSAVPTACDALVLNSKRTPNLARHGTIRRIEKTSSRVTLDSRYSVNWSKPLGEGAFGEVFIATDRKTGEQFALKKIAKKYTDDTSFQREMNALMHIRKNGGHPHICSLREQFNEGDYYYLILDLVSGGEMFDHLVKLGAYSEADAARLVREVASALAFINGIDCVHGDMKPENIMLSTENPSDSVVKLVDFGCAQVTSEDSEFKTSEKKQSAITPAYCPPEVVDERLAKSTNDPSMDMWALGIILYIMLTGMHPFDLEGNASDDEIKKNILKSKGPPLKDSPITAHLSPDAIDVIQKLLTKNPKKRMTAFQMLQHPWVCGKTARRDKMTDSDKKLSMYRVFKSGLEARVFEDIFNWAEENDSDVSKRSSLIERSFRNLDPQHKGYITAKDLRKFSKLEDTIDEKEKEGDTPLTLSGFSDLLSDHMQNKYYPKGHVLYRQGQTGNHMYFLNSGSVEVSTKKGFRVVLKQGDFFGEGALLRRDKIRSATVKCLTPVHALEISQEYFEKYLSSSGDLNLNLRVKNTSRKRERAQTILRLQKNLEKRTVEKGDYVYKIGEKGQDLFILEEGEVEMLVQDQIVMTLKPGDTFGEHSLIFSRPRTASAVCASDQCQVLVMQAADFDAFLKSSPMTRETLRDIASRREFQKAIVFKTKKPFPSDPEKLREAFDAADEDNSNDLTLDNVRSMLKRMDPSLTEKDFRTILNALDVDESGSVTFDEFKRIFNVDKKEASM